MVEKTFGEKVIAAIGDRGWSMREAARQTGVSYDVIRELHRRPGSTTGAENAQRLARALLLEDGSADVDLPAPIPPGQRAPRGAALVPVYDVSASAGNGSTVDDYEAVSHSLAFPPDYLRKLTRAHPRDLAIISVKGDSMAPRLKDDDVVMLDTSKTNLSFDGLFVLQFGEALHVKRVTRSARHGFITIISDNKDYPPQEWAADEVTVVGKVIWVGGKV